MPPKEKKPKKETKKARLIREAEEKKQRLLDLAASIEVGVLPGEAGEAEAVQAEAGESSQGEPLIAAGSSRDPCVPPTDLPPGVVADMTAQIKAAFKLGITEDKHGRLKGKGLKLKSTGEVHRPAAATTDPQEESEIDPSQQTEASQRTTGGEDDDDDHKSVSSEKLDGEMSPEQEAEIIDWVQNTPILYAKHHNSYKDRNCKTRLWAAKAKEMGIDGK